MEAGLLKEFNIIMKKENENIAIIFGLGLIGQIAIEAISELNFRIIGIDIKQEKELFDKYNNLIEYKLCDATDEDNVMTTINKIFSDYKSPNLLINALGVDSKVGTEEEGFKNLANQDGTSFNNALVQGISSYFYTSKFFVINHKKSQTYGKILNIASDLSVIAPDHRIYNENEAISKFKPAHYSVVKHAVVGLTKYFSATFGPDIITNSLSPSGIYQENMSEDFIKKLSSLTPLKRVMTREELIEPIKFLCNPENTFTTGHNLIVDGGRSVI
tara:strand:+ start:497 stop:1315 length:819 start_codon:yes stop_codon:yes gene_type:complete